MQTIKMFIPLVFLILIIVGFLLESNIFQYHFLKTGKKFKTYHYSFGRYLYYLITPTTATLYAIFSTGEPELLFIFFVFSLLGTILEWLAGFAYHMIVGQRLWTYHRHSLGGYTSFLSVPLWGVGGVLFWLLVQIFQ